MGILKNYIMQNPDKDFVMHTVIWKQIVDIAEDLQELGYKVTGYENMPVIGAVGKILKSFTAKYGSYFRYDVCWLISRSGILCHPFVSYWVERGYDVLSFYHDYALKNEKYRAPGQSDWERYKMTMYLVDTDNRELLTELGLQDLSKEKLHDYIYKATTEFVTFRSDRSVLLGMTDSDTNT